METSNQNEYKADILGDGFEQRTLILSDDYEGSVIATLVRKRSTVETTKAILYIHGFNDYFFQAEFANWCCAHGINFYAIDLRKYGRSILSHQKMNNVRDLAEYFEELDIALGILKSEGNQHVMLNGHSTGGLICTYYAQQHPHSNLFHSLFLNSPFFEFNEPWVLRKLGVPLISMIGLKMPDRLKKGGFSIWYGHSIHRSEQGEWDYNLTWKPHLAPLVNFGWIGAIHRAQIAVKTGSEIKVPLLVVFSQKSFKPRKWSSDIHASDVILNVKSIQRVSKSLNCRSVHFIQRNGLLHDVLLSPQPIRLQLYKELELWLNER